MYLLVQPRRQEPSAHSGWPPFLRRACLACHSSPPSYHPWGLQCIASECYFPRHQPSNLLHAIPVIVVHQSYSVLASRSPLGFPPWHRSRVVLDPPLPPPASRLAPSQLPVFQVPTHLIWVCRQVILSRPFLSLLPPFDASLLHTSSVKKRFAWTSPLLGCGHVIFRPKLHSSLYFTFTWGIADLCICPTISASYLPIEGTRTTIAPRAHSLLHSRPLLTNQVPSSSCTYYRQS